MYSAFARVPRRSTQARNEFPCAWSRASSHAEPALPALPTPKYRSVQGALVAAVIAAINANVMRLR